MMFRWRITLFLLTLTPCTIAGASSTETLRVTNDHYNRSSVSLPVQAETAERLFSGMPVNEVRSLKGFTTYYLNLVPLENHDFLFDAVSETVFSIDIKPLVSFSSGEVFARVNAPLNYFAYLAKLGTKIREIALKKTELDILRLKLKSLVRVEKVSLYDGYEGFIPIPQSSVLPFDHIPHGLIEQVFAESIWQLSFKDNDYAQPVVFSGFVEPTVAEQVLSNALFLDDTVFGLSWGHGKFSHLIQLGMLFDSGAVDKQWLDSMVRNDEWRHLFDRIMTGWSDVLLSTSHRTHVQRVKPVPGFSSPNALQESLVRHLFSDAVKQMAADSGRACQYLKLFFGQKAKDSEHCRVMLNAHADNLKGLENWVILDFIDDIHLMREMASGSPVFQEQLSFLIEKTRQKKQKNSQLKEVDEVLGCREEVDCLRQFVMLIGEVACMATFHNSVVKPFITLREKYYLQEGYSRTHQGDSYRVYLLPE